MSLKMRFSPYHQIRILNFIFSREHDFFESSLTSHFVVLPYLLSVFSLTGHCNISVFSLTGHCNISVFSLTGHCNI